MLNYIATAVLFTILLWVSVHDIKYHKIENPVHIFIMLSGFLIDNSISLPERAAGCLICFIPLLFANIISKNGIGMGDVKLAGAFGFVLGIYGGLSSVIVGLSLMLVTTGIYQKCKGINKAIPLAPYLCGGFVFCFLALKFIN